MEVLLAKTWDESIDPTGWWMSEKLDGVRAYWTGSRFVSRDGNEFFAPSFFTANFPRFALDGELWMGRKKFQETISIVRGHNSGDRWKQLTYAVFDCPSFEHEPFEARLDTCKRCTLAAEYAAVLDHRTCDGINDLIHSLTDVEMCGGEGLMLRRPGSLYERKRSSTLLKVKTFLDCNAVVLGYVPGEGKHRGRVGSLHVLTEMDIKCYVGSGLSDDDRIHPPAIGSRIVMKYKELTRDGNIRFPCYLGQRID